MRAGVSVRGLAPEGAGKIVGVEWFGDQAIKVTYEDGGGTVNDRLVYRSDEEALEVVRSGGPWSFEGNGGLLRLVSKTPDEAHVLERLNAELVERDRKNLYGERVRVELYFDYRDIAARDKVEHADTVGWWLEASDQTSDQKILPLWSSNLERVISVDVGLAYKRERQLLDLNRYSRPRPIKCFLGWLG